MDLYIEPLVVLALMVVFIFWRLWSSWSKKRLIKKYNPENDKARKGGVFIDGNFGIPEQRINNTIISLPGPEQFEGRGLLSETTIDDVGKDSNSTRENSSDVGRNPFKRLFRRNKKR